MSRTYKQVAYKNNKTGQVRLIGTQGWEHIKNKVIPGSITKRNKAGDPLYTKLTGKAAEKALNELAPKPSEAPPAEERTQPEERANQEIIMDAIKKKVITRNENKKGFVTFNEKSYGINAIAKNEEVMAEVKEALANCTTC